MAKPMRLLIPLVLATITLAACSPDTPTTYQGYAEGEFVQVGSPYAGALEQISVARGAQVRQGDRLFALERASEAAAVAEAEARVRTAQARQANLTQARRAAEIAALRAEVQAAGAALRLSANQLGQQERLYASGFIAQARLDEARANRDRDAARLAEARAQLRNAGESIGRREEVAAARTEVDAARAALQQAQTRYLQKEGIAPAAALVQDTYFRVGEWVPAGSPVVSLLPPENIKLRFFVPEGVVATLHPGQAVTASCSGCGAPIPARISFVSPQAEFTPPVIYSKDSRAKLVFMIEARPAARDTLRLKPGQPVDVALKEAGRP